jgi:hypothetical protein
MSLMGVLMLAGIVMSNSILIVEFAHQLLIEGLSVREAIVTSCRVRLGPILNEISRDDHWLDANGSEAWRRQRILCAAGPGVDRRLDALGCGDRIYRADWIFPGVSEAIK